MRQTNIVKVISILEKYVSGFDTPVAELVAARTKDPFKILVSTMLSARTKDEVTAEVSLRLFRKVNGADDLGRMSVSQIEKLIYPVGFYRTKARNLKKLPQTLKAEFGGKIPRTIDGLMKIDGVGRKTANLVVSVAFSGEGICVDTHVHRIMNWLGYVRTQAPFETEKALRNKLPRKLWRKVNHVLVAFGQNTCRPVSPFCSACPVYDECNRVGVGKRR